MRTAARRFVLLLATGLLACSGAPKTGDAVIVAQIVLENGVSATCVQLNVTDSSGNSLDITRLNVAPGQSSFDVGIYQGPFPTTIDLVAQAFTGASTCSGSTTLVASSAQASGTFTVGQETTVTLDILCAGDGGGCGCSGCGTLDAGARDAGVGIDSGPGSDAGTGNDSGAGIDSGTTGTDSGGDDSGSVDSGASDAAVSLDAAIGVDAATSDAAGVDAGLDAAVPPDAGVDAGVDSGVPCNGTTCPSGCCDNSGNCQTSAPGTCGLRGASCVDCTSTSLNCLAGQCTAAIGFPYDPSNFNPSQIPVNAIGGSVTLDCGAIFNSGDGGFSNWCGQPTPTPIFQLQTGDAGPLVVVLPMSSFAISDAGDLQIIGSNPVIVAVYGSATIDGNVNVDAQVATSGPGGGLAGYCGTSTGTQGAAGFFRTEGAGGGGGGFAIAGANGGDTDVTGTHGNGGAVTTVPGKDLIPLRGGCGGGPGGPAGESVGAGGGGGGAFQISAAGQLSIHGTLSASGGGGGGGIPLTGVGTGAGGGGSGGAILIEGNTVVITGTATFTANGGGGGEGGGSAGANGSAGSPGNDNSTTPAPGGSGGTATAGAGGNGGSAGNPPTTGAPAVGGNAAGGGGGGGAPGVLRMNAGTSCSAAGATPVVSPGFSSNGKPGCP